MIRHRDDECMGRFSVEVELANNDDLALVRRGSLPSDRVRRVKVKGVVDSGAAMLVIPQHVARTLELPVGDKTRVKYADGRKALRDLAEGVYLQFGDRHGVFEAVVEPKRTEALIGAIVLERLDLIVDCKHMTLVPRDPKYIIAEIE
jgi:predicted aspartyl protease